MTDQEAIEALKLEGGIEITGSPRRIAKFFEALDMAISALKEIQQYMDNRLCLIPEDVYSKQCEELDAYKEIGTVEDCREAAEKQKPKNPETYTETVQTVTGCFEVDVFECPVCGSYVCNVGDELPNYCDNCGQALGESEEE